MEIKEDILRNHQEEKVSKPIKNQKISEAQQKKQEEKTQKGLVIREAQLKIFEQKKKELPTLLKNKLQEISDNIGKMVRYDKDNNPKISPAEVYEWIKAPLAVPVNAKYSAEELDLILENYSKTIAQINSIAPYHPTKTSFCMFCGISTSQYNQWIMDVDYPERYNAMRRIDDYITDLQQTMAQTGELKEITTIFRMKSEHGRVEAKAPQEIKVEHGVNTSQILEQMNAIKQGKSLKQVELYQDDEGVWREEE